MSLHSEKYIKKLFTDLSLFVPVTSGALEKMGISRQLRYRYVKSGWLEKVSDGLYKLPKARLIWAGGLHCLCFQMNKQVHVGARTALELHGFGHFLPLSVQKIFIFCPLRSRIPKWFTSYPWQDAEIILSSTAFLPPAFGVDLKEVDRVSIPVSAPERAFLEVLYLLEKFYTFDEVVYLSEGLSNLRPSVMQELLVSCSSKKVKRLALLLGQYHQHLWYKRLILGQIDLGEGVLQVKGGGRYIAEFKLSIPKKLDEYSNV